MANYTLNYTGEDVDRLLEKIDTAFGETTTYGDTLTWDGDMTGKVYSEMEMPIDDEGNTTIIRYVKVSNSIPTIEELQNGGIIRGNGQTYRFPEDDEPTDIGSAIMINQYVLIAKEENADLTGVLDIVLPESGVYLLSVPAMGGYMDTFTINNYTGFPTTEIKTIDPKYIPNTAIGDIAFLVEDYNYNDPTTATATCNKAFYELSQMSDESLLNAIATLTISGNKTVTNAILVTRTANTSDPNNPIQIIDFKFPATIVNNVMKYLDIIMTSQGTIMVM